MGFSVQEKLGKALEAGVRWGGVEDINDPISDRLKLGDSVRVVAEEKPVVMLAPAIDGSP